MFGDSVMKDTLVNSYTWHFTNPNNKHQQQKTTAKTPPMDPRGSVVAFYNLGASNRIFWKEAWPSSVAVPLRIHPCQPWSAGGRRWLLRILGNKKQWHFFLGGPNIPNLNRWPWMSSVCTVYGIFTIVFSIYPRFKPSWENYPPGNWHSWT